MTSLDGKIMGTYMDTPEGTAAGEMFYDIAFGKDAFYKHEGWISGRVTTDDNFTFYEKPDLDEDAPEVSVGGFIVTAERPMYYVSIDRSGRRPLGEVSGNECQRIGHGKEKNEIYDSRFGSSYISVSRNIFRGKPAQELKPGDVVHIPANVKHWHGAAKDSAFQHIAVEVPGENPSNEWCEPVSEKDYNRLP